MKRFVTAALFAAALAAPAMADDQAAANERCVALANSQVEKSLPPDAPAEQKQMVGEMVVDMCGCMTAKIGELGDDGAKVLHVIATQSEEDAQVADPAEQKKRSVAKLVADFGMSEDEAGALYDRVNPQVEQIAQSCAADAQQKLMQKLAPAQ